MRASTPDPVRRGLILAACFVLPSVAWLSLAEEHRFSVPRSRIIQGLEWLGPIVPYHEEGKRGDTYPLTWARDGEIYTSAGDPGWTIGDYQQKKDEDLGLDVEMFSGNPPDYRIERINDMDDFLGGGGGGPKPSGMISVDGVLYLAVQNLTRENRIPPFRHPAAQVPESTEFGAIHLPSQRGSEAGIFRSSDFGKTWSPDRSAPPMFRGYLFGGPAFINFGKDNENARDGFVYAVSGDQWDNGTELRLGRVPKDRILERSAWEWVGGFKDAGRIKPVWTGDLDKSVPILSEMRHTGLPDMVYLAKINRYLLITWHMKFDYNPYFGSQLIIYESPEPWGPFALAHFETDWEGRKVTPYCPRLPLKWLEGDGVTGWLQFSGAWWPGRDRPYYRSNIRKFRLRLLDPALAK